MEQYFDDSSLLREIVGHRLTGLSGPRALLVMAAHPVAFAGFFAHTGALDDPYARLQRTAKVMDAVAFGSKQRADKLTKHVRAMHRTVSGQLDQDAGPFPAGTPYRADDPKLLLWILAALAESAMLVYTRYVRSLTRDELNAVWGDYQSSAGASACASATCRATSTASRPTWPACTRAASCTSPTRRASSRSTSSCARRYRCTCGHWSNW